nr:hypothetical protein [Tanacetum cinerariifolium]
MDEDPDEEPKEDPQENPEEEPEEDPQEDLEKEQEEEEKEPEEAQQMDWEEDEDDEPEEAPVMGTTLPPPPASLDTEPVANIAGFRALSAAQETSRVENIRLRRELEEAQISNNYAAKKIKGSYLNKKSKRAAMEKLIADRVAKAIAEHERNRPNPANAEGSGNVQGCSHKTFMNGKPYPFNETEGVVGLRRWIEKIEQVFEISKCAEGDKVMFAASNFEDHDDYRILYCPATEIQMMEQELWTLTLKGDDIEAYNNRFHVLALMCPDLVPTKKKKIRRYIKGFPEKIKGNITSSKPTALHDAINMARELVEQVVQGRAARIGKSNKTKWEEHQRNTNNNNPNHHNNRNRNHNTHHQQPNRRQEATKSYVATTAENMGYAGNLPKCNHCNSHHNGQFPPKCQSCGEKRHYKNKCPKERNQQNERARARAYVVVENPQQNPNVVMGTFLLNDHYACILFVGC